MFFKHIKRQIEDLADGHSSHNEKITDIRHWLNEICDELGLHKKTANYWTSFAYTFENRSTLKKRVEKLEEQNKLLMECLSLQVTEIQGTPSKKVLTKIKKVKK